MSDWKKVFEADGFPLRVERVDLDGYSQHRVVVGGLSAGAVGLVVDDDGRVLLVRQYRRAIDKTLWELPRGMADASDADLVATARREVREETRIELGEGELLGYTYPDSGVLASEVAVVALSVTGETKPTFPADGEVEDYRWATRDELKGLVAAGELADSLSLAALAMVQLS